MEKGHMKILMGVILALSAVLSQPAAAGPWRNFGGPRFDVQAQRQRPGGYQRQQQPQRDFRGSERQQPQRDYRGPERQQPQRDYRGPERQPERRPDGRLTDEERRDLHRDLDRANREIYKGR
jgi:hypothetical protein